MLVQFFALWSRKRVRVGEMHASVSATASDTDLKLPKMAEANRHDVGSSAFKTRFDAVGGHFGEA